MPQLLELSRAMRLLLLERSVLAIHEMYGLPYTLEAEAFFQSEVSILYQCCLIARRSAPPRTFTSAARAQILVQYAAKHGALAAQKMQNQAVYCRSLRILAAE